MGMHLESYGYNSYKFCRLYISQKSLILNITMQHVSAGVINLYLTGSTEMLLTEKF
jgi:hypothetical protein